MAQHTLAARVQILEETVQTFADLPARMTAVETQIVQFRIEVRGEFAAIRAEMATDDEGLRREIREGDEETRRLMTDQMAELRTHMHVLHEDVISRLTMLLESSASRPRARRRKR